MGGGVKIASLKFSRDDEYEADAFGLEIAARSGYDLRAGRTLFNKIKVRNSDVMVSWLSAHPANDERIVKIDKNIAKTLPFYLENSKK